MRSRLRRLTRLRFTRNIAVLAGSATVAQVAALLSMPVLTRLYSPVEIGLLGIWLSFLGFAGELTAFRYDAAIITPRSDRAGARLFVLAAVVTLPASLALTLGLYALIEAGVLGFERLPLTVTPLAFLSLVLIGTFSSCRFWLIRRHETTPVSQATVSRAVSRGLAQIALGIPQIGWIGLIIGDVVGRIAGLGRMLQASRSGLRENLTGVRSRQLRATARRFRDFPRYALPSTALNALTLSLPVPLVIYLFGLDSGGQFTLAQRAIAAPMALIGGAVADAFHAEFGERSRRSILHSMRLFYRTASWLVALAVIPAAVVLIVGPQLFALVFGPDWESAGHLARWMTPWLLAQLVVSPLSRAVFVLEKQRLKLAYDILALLLTLGSFALAYLLGLPLRETVALLSATQALAYAFYFLLLRRVVMHSASRA